MGGTPAKRDDNYIPVALGIDSTNPNNTLPIKINPVTGRVITQYTGGTASFITLTDTPSSYVGQALKVIRVNAGETGLEFVTLAGGGSVTTVSVVSANGFAGSVANPSTIPAITLSTTVNGMAKGNGTALQTATDGTDYYGPSSKDASGGVVGLTLFKINFKNTLNTITSFFTNSNTVARTYTFPDKDGTVAMTSDITGTNSGTNTGDVTLAGTPNYLTIVGQVITRNLINLTAHVTGLLPFANIANIASGSVLYRKTAGTGAIEAQTLATLKTDLALTGTNSGDETTTTIGTLINGSTNKTTPVDADSFAIRDSVGGLLQQVTLANLKAVLKTYFDSLATTLTNKTLTKPILNGSVPAVTADTDGATITFDMSASNIHTVTLGGNRTLAVSNVSTNQNFMIRLKQDATGSRTVTWFGTITWAGGSAPTLTTTASKEDCFGFICTGAGTYNGFVIYQNL